MTKYNRRRIMTRDGDFDSDNRRGLGNAKDDIDATLHYVRKAQNDLTHTENYTADRKMKEAVKTLSKVIITLYDARDLVSDDEKEYQSKYEDSCDECRIVKRADSYLVMKGNKVIVEYGDLDLAKRFLRMLKERRTHDGKREC